MLGRSDTLFRARLSELYLLARRPLLTFAILAGALTLARIIGLMVSPLNLHGDEAQYWSWSRSLDWGYFSKPPLIAWVIAATTSVFGDAEWAVRLSAPIAHGATAVILARLAGAMFGPRAIWWAGGVYIVMPAVWLSASVISTDALLLTCWSAALLCAWRLREGGGWANAAGLGAAIGLGLLAKYAMIYFPLGLALCALADRDMLRALISPKGALATALAAALIAPNLIWNAANSFVTVGHTAANANLGGSYVNFDELFEFWFSQLGVFGPLTIGLLIWALVVFIRKRPERDPRFMFLWSFVIPPLAIVSVGAFLSRANANWAATAYPAACVLLAGWIIARAGLARTLAAIAVVLHAGTGVVFASLTISPALADAVGMSNAFKRARGWPETVSAVREVFEAGHDGRNFTLIAVDNRLLFHGLEYYGRADPLPLRMWLRHAAPTSYAEQSAPLVPGDDAASQILVLNERGYERARIDADFVHFEPVGELSIPTGRGRRRDLAAFAAEGFVPIERGAAYEEMYGD